MNDRAVVERQLGRPPRAFLRVARRCPFGRPAVTEQSALDERGEPFPTTFWLTCPQLVAAISQLESGVAGATRAGSLKCLHAHAAFALARPGYELGERILAEVKPLWPSDE